MAAWGSLPLSLTLQGCGRGDGDSPAQAPLTVGPFVAVPEDAAHASTYMAFASDADGIWTQPSADNAGLDRVRTDLIDVAKAIGRFEPVVMMVLSQNEAKLAQSLLDRSSAANPAVHAGYIGRASGVGGVSFVVTPAGFNDYWTRDTAPVFARDGGRGQQLVAVDFNFNGWGNANSQSTEAPAESNQTKREDFFQPYENDRKVARFIAGRVGAAVLGSSLVMEGGALELDGHGTAIITASSVLHVNRNPQLFNVTMSGARIVSATLRSDAKATVEAELRRVLGVTRVIWLSGTATFPAVTVSEESDITNGHADFYAKFLAPGVVAYASDPQDSTAERAITATHLAELSGQTDAQGRSLTLVPLLVPTAYGAGLQSAQQANFAAGYINMYFCNGAVVVPSFGDTVADAAAVAAIRPHVGARTVVQVDITGIASGGGGLHCATAQVPA